MTVANARFFLWGQAWMCLAICAALVFHSSDWSGIFITGGYSMISANAAGALRGLK